MKVRTKQILAISIGVLVGGVMILLGVWQGSRYQASIEDVAGQRAQEAAVPLAPHVHPDGTIDDVYGKQVSVVGTWVPGVEVYVGTETPMRYANAFEMEDGRFLPIVLGHTDAAAVDWPGETVEVVGIFTSGDPAADAPVPDAAPSGSMSSLRVQQLAQSWPSPMIAGYITVLPETSAEFGMTPATPVLPEQEGTGMHRGYALQWWVFAIAAVAFGFVVARGFKPAPAKALATTQ